MINLDRDELVTVTGGTAPPVDPEPNKWKTQRPERPGPGPIIPPPPEYLRRSASAR